MVRWFLPARKSAGSGASIMLQPALLSLASVASQCPKLSLAVPARDAANTLQASLSGWSVPQVEWRASSYCSKAVDAFQWLAKLTRTPRGLHWVRTGYAYEPPAPYRRRRAAQGPVYCTYWVGVPASAVPYVPRTVATQVARLRGRPECRLSADLRARPRRRSARLACRHAPRLRARHGARTHGDTQQGGHRNGIWLT